MKLPTRTQRTWLLLALLGVTIGIWVFLTSPQNDRPWSPDQALLPYAEFTADTVTVHNIRNFTYTATDTYTPRYEKRTYNLNELTTIDYIVEPFGSIGAAHTFVSFGFADGEQLAISAEIRKEVGETFSPLKGVLRQYELMYVVADERDVIQLRTNHRQNNVYLYPIDTSQENMQALFMDMLTRVNQLRAEPQLYNTITNNCTTNIAAHINTIAPNTIPLDIRLLLPKNSDALAYEVGLIQNDLPLDALRAKHLITHKAQTYTGTTSFSAHIRR